MGLGGILSIFGLGQDDLKNVFEETLKRLSRQDIQTAQLRQGQYQAVATMMRVLHEGDVMNSDTLAVLLGRLERWASMGPRK